MHEAERPHRLLRASAGTGKTYQLVEAYVAQVLEHGLRPSQIVAITFTRKAAAELRGRIRKRLLAANVPPTLLSELTHAPISNFHGLALQLLRGFGPTAGFGAATEILGEAGDDLLLFLQACEDAWFGGDPEVGRAVQELASYLGVDWDLPAALWQAIGRAREDGQPIDRHLLGTYATATVRAAVHAELMGVRANLTAAHAAQTGRGKEKIAAFLASPMPAADASLPHWAAAWRQAGACLDRRGNLRLVFSEDDQALFTDGLLQVRAENICEQAAGHLGLLLETAWTAYQAMKARRRLFDFGDLVERLVHVLERDAAAHEGLRERYRAVLVDEAQDTNRLQRRMVHLLSGLAGPAAETTPAAHLFVVGDWKQSIYTFRGADPQSFGLFADDLRARGGVEGTLAVSRRSTPALVDGINHLGVHVFGDAYEPLAPLVASPDAGDRAATDPAPAAAPAMHWCTLPAAAPEDTPAYAALSEHACVARLIAARLETGLVPGDFAVLLATMTQAPLFARALADHGIPAVLGGGGGLYEQIEIIDMVALLAWLCDPLDRLSAAIALRSPLFGVSDSGLLALFAGQDDGLTHLRAGAWPAGRAAQHADEALLTRLAGVLPTLVGAAQTLGPAACLEHLDATLDIRAVYLSLEGGEQRVANLNRFTELAARAEQNGISPRQFVRQQLERLRRGHAEPLTPVPAAARRAVTISSVHQSKGLQYAVVVLANLDRKGRGDTAAVRYHREHGLVFRPRVDGDNLKTARWQRAQAADTEVAVGELRRLLYVAVTRAEREVLFVGAAKLGRDGFARFLGPWAETARQAGVLHAEPVPPPIFHAAATRGAPLAATPAAVWLEATTTTLPAGTHFELTVTQLETLANPVASGSLEQAAHWQARAALAHPDRDPPLDPLQRGRLAHAVLAAVERRIEQPSVAVFIAAELRQAGYDPADPRLLGVQADLLHFLESPLGRLILKLDPAQRRHELPFQLAVAASPYRVTLHGQIDLLYWDNEGPVVVDFKHAHAATTDLGPYETQLNAYALATAKLCQVGGDPIRTRLVFLRDRDRPVEHLVTPALRLRVEKQISAAAALLAQGSRGAPLPRSL